MLSMSRVRKNARTLAAATCTTLILASTPAWAQDAAAADPNPGALTITGSVDFLNQYMFRGIRQNNDGLRDLASCSISASPRIPVTAG